MNQGRSSHAVCLHDTHSQRASASETAAEPHPLRWSSTRKRDVGSRCCTIANMPEHGCFQRRWQQTSVLYFGEPALHPCQGVHDVERERDSQYPIIRRLLLYTRGILGITCKLCLRIHTWNPGVNRRDSVVIIGWELQSQVQLRLHKHVLKSSGSNIWLSAPLLRNPAHAAHSNRFPSAKKERNKERESQVLLRAVTRKGVTWAVTYLQPWLRVTEI